MACGQVDSTSIINCVSYTPFPHGFHGFLLGVGNNKSHSIAQQETVLLPQTWSQSSGIILLLYIWTTSIILLMDEHGSMLKLSSKSSS